MRQLAIMTLNGFGALRCARAGYGAAVAAGAVGGSAIGALAGAAPSMSLSD
ncbi:hypothetical protein H8A95_04305 [Bradyrhizobium sp. Pear76]|uniref:hypothetical protein n=1 Tax=Bradyrhizobium oropedii TaxID=1571201 RepID=UPI001E3D4816|nr:hypothetical protein [Bradyrhizobium oropedii]MCC8961562.1 hypothetical protein [Bradyrhizobium oropedii]